MDPDTFYGRFSTKTRDAGSPRSLLDRETFKKHRISREIPLMLAAAFILVFGFVRPFIVEPMRVPSGSMTPTLQVHDRVLTNKLAYDFTEPDRGDLAVFKSVENNDELVKRVVGLPGDVVRLDRGALEVNGKPVNEPYLSEKTLPKSRRNAPGVKDFGPMFVPEDTVFVMGDNRANSYDSRFFGPVPTKNLIGEPSLRFWPLNRLDIL